LDPVGAAAQIRGGKDALEQLLGQPVEGFCYPGGKFDRRIQDSVREAGFRYARTVENFRTDSGTDPYRVPTTLQCYPHSRWTLAWNYLRYGAATVRWPAFRTAFLATDWTDRVRQLAATLTGTNAVLHLWGHSWEIEALGLWREVDELLAYLASLRPKVAEVGQIVPNLS
jgi:peptidoglycan/xylan/chitin deacetylase (PgdA/CDA1 family)